MKTLPFEPFFSSLSQAPSSADLSLESSGSSSTLYALSLRRQNSFSENQLFVDQLVTGLIESPRASILLAVVGGGWAYRFTQMGFLSAVSLPQKSSVLPVLVRGASYGIALGSESAVFAGIDGGIRRLEGEPPPHSYPQEWAGAAINLGSLKLLMGVAGAQNLVLQHLLTDMAMVGGHRLGARWGLTAEPQGNFTEQMMQAEGMNWSIKAGMQLLNGASPRLSVAERSWELHLRSQERNLFSRKAFPLSLFAPQPAPAAGGAAIPPEAFSKSEGWKRPRPLMMTKVKDGESPPGEGASGPQASNPSTSEPPAVQVELIDGRYRVDEFLQQGGMGVVYKATHVNLDRKVAIKVLLPELSRDPGAIERFRLEAKAASAIGHPHIVDILDFGTFPDGSTYFVMEYLNGVPLSKLIEGNRAAPGGRFLPIARQIAEGLSAAHQAGIVHRDLKPDNIFLVDRGSKKDFVKILDFGIAKMATTGPKLTQSGIIFGTADYMSPEQGLGQPIDHRSDIYSYGIMLYELATGRLPFVGENAMSIMTKKVTEKPPRFSELDPPIQEIVPGIEAVILKCLSKEAGERYPSMNNVIADLDKLQSGQVSTAETEKRMRTWKKRLPLAAGVIGGGAATAVIAALILSRNSSPSAPPPSLNDASTTADGPPVADANTSVSTPPPPDAAARKKTTLIVEPSDAHVFRGDLDLGAGRVTIEIEEGKAVELEIRRKRFKTKKITLDGTEESARIRLERETASKPRPPKPPKPPKKPENLENPWKK